jgi:lysophospholipase L1-like esterase
MGRRAPRPAVSAGLASVLALGLSLAPVPAAMAASTARPGEDGAIRAARPAVMPVPGRMAALGDSITRAFNSCGWFADCVGRSWATGPDDGVGSHYLRLREHNGSLVAHNNAVTRARVAALAEQANQAVAQGAGYVTILIGANDACASTEEGMTPVADYEDQFRDAMRTLRDGLSDAQIFVSSIPDLRRLWRVGKNSGAARAAWALFRTCRSMLARPTSMADADVARRKRVRERVIDYNETMARVCAQDVRCRFDGNAVFSHRFTLEQVSKWDYFHPNVNGQEALARVTYAESFWSATAPAGRRGA